MSLISLPLLFIILCIGAASIAVGCEPFDRLRKRLTRRLRQG